MCCWVVLFVIGVAGAGHVRSKYTPEKFGSSLWRVAVKWADTRVLGVSNEKSLGWTACHVVPKAPLRGSPRKTVKQLGTGSVGHGTPGLGSRLDVRFTNTPPPSLRVPSVWAARARATLLLTFCD